MTELKRRRYEGHQPFNDLVREDWMNAIKLDPDAFDALLYLPVMEQLTPEQESNYESDSVTEIDSNQDTLSYGDPILVSVLDCPDENETFSMMAQGDEGLGESELPLALRVAYPDVPQGAVLEWVEETSEGDRRVWWYVHSSVGFGSAAVGALSICIPCRDFDAGGIVEPRS
ncbi:hypothetical protein [Photobacterium leiognathi]|uniref:hypothetical protein n=1 Tax=Photobacterium leiognathi TaxID=553611 RepID=UPI0029819FA4|nr:hypothetical protein [Photobacterium leiognathi]